MKRGLVQLDPTETPAAELERRVGELEGALADAGVDAALVYGDVHHSGDITYLSNICIYWNEGMLAVQGSAPPAFLTKLSPRVHPWMRATSNLDDLRSGPNLAKLAGDLLAGRDPGVVGLVEMDWWPGPLVAALGEALPGWELRDLGEVVRRARRRPSTSELALLAAGSSVTAAAVLAGAGAGLSAAERAGKAEFAARAGGVEDVRVHSHRVVAAADSLEVTGEYRGYWTTASRVVGAGAPDWVAAMRRAFAGLEGALRPGVAIDELETSAGEHLAGLGLDWEVDLVDHADLETDGDYRNEDDRRRPVGEGAVVGLRLAAGPQGHPPAVLADTYAVGGGAPRRLTGELPEIAP